MSQHVPACGGECTTHGVLCDLDDGHPGDHECPDCPANLARQRKAMIADRVAAHRLYTDLIETTPDVD